MTFSGFKYRTKTPSSKFSARQIFASKSDYSKLFVLKSPSFQKQWTPMHMLGSEDGAELVRFRLTYSSGIWELKHLK